MARACLSCDPDGLQIEPGSVRQVRASSAKRDVAAAFLRLWRPLRAKFSPGRARVRLSGPAVDYAESDVELEAFARPLWGVVPFIAGGGRFPDWDLYLDGLGSGTDPRHPVLGRRFGLSTRAGGNGSLRVDAGHTARPILAAARCWHV